MTALNPKQPSCGDEQIKLYLYVSTSSSQHKEFLFEKDCSIDDVQYALEELIDSYGEGHEILSLPVYAGLYVTDNGEAIKLGDNESIPSHESHSINLTKTTTTR